MGEAVNRLAFCPDSVEMFDHIEGEALMRVPDEGEVLLVTKHVADDKVDVLLVFPTLKRSGWAEHADDEYQPTAIRITMNCFLNAARMVAIHHQAVIGKMPNDMPEAMTHEQAGRILVPGDGK